MIYEANIKADLKWAALSCMNRPVVKPSAILYLCTLPSINLPSTDELSYIENYFLFPSDIEMIVTSGNSSLKKYDSATLNTIMLRTDGFKNVFRGLTYKSSKPSTNVHSGTYTSIGKRTPAKEYTLTKQSQSRFYQDLNHSGQMRRTQTAGVKQRAREGENREKQFQKSDQQQNECFARMMSKLGI